MAADHPGTHSPGHCPLLRQPLALAQQLQDCTRQLLNIIAETATTTQPGGVGADATLAAAMQRYLPGASSSAPESAISRAIQYWCARKAFIECLLHGADGQLAFHGAAITGFQVDPARLQSAHASTNPNNQIVNMNTRIQQQSIINNEPAEMHLISPINARATQLSALKPPKPPKSHVQQQQQPMEPRQISSFREESAARFQNDAVLMSLLPAAAAMAAQGATASAHSGSNGDSVMVADRTRAKLPLNETSIDDLEKLLVDMDEATHQDDDRYSDADYRHFVQSLAHGKRVAYLSDR